MNECYIELPIKIYPLTQTFDEYLQNLPVIDGFRRMDKTLGIDSINPELLEYFKDLDIKIWQPPKRPIIFWNWRTKHKENSIPHTDGDYRLNNELVGKRECGINWNFTPNTRVEFYSKEGATPVFVDKGDVRHIWPEIPPWRYTDWLNCKTIIDIWDTPGPVLFNPQVPHDIKSDEEIDRLAITLRFDETYESMRKKLKV